MTFKEGLKAWWADDWHIIPRLCRDIWGMWKGREWERVGVWEISYDGGRDILHMDYRKAANRDLPFTGDGPHAKHVTGKGWRVFAVDRDGAGRPPGEGELTAIDLYLLAKTDAFDPDNLYHERGAFSIDTKTLAVAIGAIVAIGAAWFIWKGLM